MQKLKISYNSIDDETGKSIIIIKNYSCEVNDNDIFYVDDNDTKHHIIIGDNELWINSVGQFDVKNHYSNYKDTNLDLTYVEKNQSFKLNVKTEQLVIEKNLNEVNIFLKYNLYEQNNFISDHEIKIEVS